MTPFWLIVAIVLSLCFLLLVRRARPTEKQSPRIAFCLGRPPLPERRMVICPLTEALRERSRAEPPPGELTVDQSEVDELVDEVLLLSPLDPHLHTVEYRKAMREGRVKLFNIPVRVVTEKRH